MLQARKALRQIYADSLKRNIIEETLKEMKARGLPSELYEKYLKEAKDIGLIPVSGRSKVGGKILKESDILTIEDILEEFDESFEKDYGFYGVG